MLQRLLHSQSQMDVATSIFPILRPMYKVDQLVRTSKLRPLLQLTA